MRDYKELCIDLLYEKLKDMKEQAEEIEEKYDRLRIEFEELEECYESLKKSIKADSLKEHEEDTDPLKFLDDDSYNKELNEVFGDLNEDTHSNIKKETIKKSRKSRDSFGRFKK